MSHVKTKQETTITSQFYSEIRFSKLLKPDERFQLKLPFFWAPNQ